MLSEQGAVLFNDHVVTNRYDRSFSPQHIILVNQQWNNLYAESLKLVGAECCVQAIH
jgi:hypothetical protein